MGLWKALPAPKVVWTLSPVHCLGSQALRYFKSDVKELRFEADHIGYRVCWSHSHPHPLAWVDQFRRLLSSSRREMIGQGWQK